MRTGSRNTRPARLLVWVAAITVAVMLGAGPVSAQSASYRAIIRSLTSPVEPRLESSPTTAATDANACALRRPGSDAATSDTCLTCHAGTAVNSHPYDLRYQPYGSSSGPEPLRPVAEALRRGAFLPEGQVRCVTCHDGKSPWKYAIRLPAGAPLTHAVDFARPQTYENPRLLPPPRPGDAVGVKPLCLGCHALD